MAKMMKARKTKPAKARLARSKILKKKSAATRTSATNVLAQGVGAVPSRPFGSVRARPTLSCWDAKLPQHLALPRAVGPYTTVRTTRRINSSSKAVIFGAFKAAGDGFWTNTCAIEAVDSGFAINYATANAKRYVTPMTMSGIGTSAATCVPSAVTVQILNPEALQTTNGIIYAGVMNTQANIGGRTSTWTAWFDAFINYMSPRLLSAAKLSLRGVQMNSYPLNMTPLSEFTELAQYADGTFVYDEAQEECTGWAPMLVRNPGAVGLEYLVTTEWRVRFDLANPASAGHVHHPIHHDSDWDRLMKQASAMGHGVQDIADVVANVGVAAETAARVASIFPRA